MDCIQFFTEGDGEVESILAARGIIMPGQDDDFDLGSETAPGDPFTIEHAWETEPFLSAMDNVWGLAIVDDDGAVLAAAKVDENFHGSSGTYRLNLERVFVRPDMRGRGLCANITDAMIEIFEARMKRVPENPEAECVIRCQAVSPGGQAILDKFIKHMENRRDLSPEP